MDKSVDLRPAFAWTCDNCGKDNYCEGIIPDVKEITPDIPELEELNKLEGARSAWIMIPNKVMCNNCKAMFITIPPGGSMEENES